ncbi:hypothetical protein DRQ36_07350 [bacterium]|nr:MAG: hypothetical protein DRQ36_07350 [bacterium]
MVVVSAIIGSRVFYVVFHLDEFRGKWLDIINPFHGPGGFGIAGLSMMGGVALVVIAVYLYTVVKKLDFCRVGDTIAPTFLLGAGITRIGCFLNGCCYGRPTTAWFGVNFPDGAASDYLRYYLLQYPDSGVTGLIPTQLMASALGFALFFLVLWLERWHKFDGWTSWLVLGLYSLDRFFVDQFRYYEPKQVLAHFGPILITVNEIVLFLLFVFSAIMFAIGLKKVKVKR